MTYWPCIGQVIFITGGMVVTLKSSSLKHRVPFNLSVVFEMYTANPKKSVVNQLSEPEMRILYKYWLHKIITREIVTPEIYTEC